MTTIFERALVAWPLLLAVPAMFGSAAFALFVAPSEVRATARLARWWRWLAALNLVCLVLLILLGVASMASEPIAQALGLVPDALRQTHVGRVWLWHVPASVALMAVAIMSLHRASRAGAICALAALVLLLQSLESHAIDSGAIAVGMYFIHELAAGLWIGALAWLTALWLEGGVGVAFAAGARRVSRVAAWSVAALVLTGLYNAWHELGWSSDRILYSLYGRTLLWKLATFALAILLAARHRYRLMPALAESDTQESLVRSVAIETLVLAGVLAWSALLANTPPPH